jgi:DNA-3-methyladenine glycosylase
LPRDFFRQNTLSVAQALLGCLLIRDEPDGCLIGRIAETEAYTQVDPACHAFRGQTARNATMFGPPGHAYIYFTYGMHHCFNAVTAEAGQGEAVLIRAVEPLTGWERMAARRGLTEAGKRGFDLKTASEAERIRRARALCGGPGKLCQAFGLDRTLNGTDLTTGSHLWLAAGDTVPPEAICATPRIGITLATDRLWRFTRRGDPFTSRPGDTRQT